MSLRIERLKARHHFLNISNKGHKAVTRSFVVFCLFDMAASEPHLFDSCDLLAGFTVSKKNGNAVKRNRIKRRLKSVMSEVLPDVPPIFKGAGIVVVARYPAIDRDFNEMKEEARKCLNWLRKQVVS